MPPQTPRQNYLQGEVYTATPQKLQLLLIEAAIKNIHRTKLLWKEAKFDVAFEFLARAQDIVAEILCSLDMEGNPELAKRIGSIYVFIFRRLAEGGMSHDESKLDDALRILNSERETWRLVCEKFGSTKNDATGKSTKPTIGKEDGSGPEKKGTDSVVSWSSSAPAPIGIAARNSSVKLDISSTLPDPSAGKPTPPRPAAPPRPLPNITPTAPVTSLLNTPPAGNPPASGKTLADFALGTTASSGTRNLLNAADFNPR